MASGRLGTFAATVFFLVSSGASVHGGTPRKPTTFDLFADQTAAPAAQGFEQGVKRHRNVRLNAGLIKAISGKHITHLRIRLFDDTSVVILIDRVTNGSNGSITCVGRADAPDSGYLVLYEHDGTTAATLRLPGRGVFSITAGQGAEHRLLELDPAGRFSCGEVPATKRIGSSLEFIPSIQPPGEPRGTGPGCDDGTVIDMMVVYTADARAAAGGTANILAQINTAVADTNLAFSNSLINCSVNLVHTEEVVYTETGDSLTDLPRLHDPTDGFLDNVHPLRDQHGADIVALWVETLEVGGRIYERLNATGSSGFHEMRRDNWNILTLAHELGHNLGCAHDRANEFFNDNYFTYSYGYHEPGATWRTIMAVSPPANLVISHFANPSVDFSGTPTGVVLGQPDEADCATTINATRHLVANFRHSASAGLPSVLYVDASALPGGDGLTWPTAFDDLQDALCEAARSNGDVDEIWVAAGTYTPDLATGLRQMTFVLRDDLAVYGGFNGTETQRSQRDIVTHVTRLSGDIGVLSDGSDNALQVVTGAGVGSTAILDGFEIADGNADVVNNFLVDTGAGLRNDDASPTISNCTFLDNTATIGAGMLNTNGSNPTVTGCTFQNNAATSGAGMNNDTGSAPSISGCTFTANVATFVGGAMHNDQTSPSVDQTTFSGNTADFGGAVENNLAAPDFSNCTFNGTNSATSAGGAVNNNAGDATFDQCDFDANTAPLGGAIRNLNASPVFTGCTFSGNSAGSGGALINQGASNPILNGCDFDGNMADSGGAVESFANSPTFNGCTFTMNDAVNGGGAMTIGGVAQPAFDQCEFNGNTAGFGGAAYLLSDTTATFTQTLFCNNSANDGGAMYLFDAHPALASCTFEGNSAGMVPFGVGGAMFNLNGSTPLISSTTFITNSSGFGGGAVRNDASDAHFANCRFFGNSTDWSGGAIENINSTAIIIGCGFSGNQVVTGHGGAVSNMVDSNALMMNLTIAGNSAGGSGGGIAVDATAPVLANSLVYGNMATFGTTESQQIHHFAGATLVNHCSIEGWTGALGGSGNDGNDPMLIDVDGADNTAGTLDDDLRLSAGSSAIDSGDNTAVAADETDVDNDANVAERLPLDADGNPRFVDDPSTTDSGMSDPPDYPFIVDRGAFEFQVAPTTCVTCPGDLDGSTRVDGNDIQQFVDCLLAGPSIDPGCLCADMDTTTTIEMSDVGPFVSELLSTTGCP